ncbi:hypothetical protein M407DRAFT_211140 [Tulasnella calospora MUT 4182]|uniref:Uncharacterized protein n=1 Tax=Tulasnella calospora MUT 4182 TaxID=1051891 RepID=A0A0C3QFT1_9AGAM|nr:hypothetical protein M407DRAFT_211140 [Tulasnella calospora MUT 4182]
MQFRGAPAAILSDFQNSAVRRGAIRPISKTITSPVRAMCPIRAVNTCTPTSSKLNGSGLREKLRPAGPKVGSPISIICVRLTNYVLTWEIILKDQERLSLGQPKSSPPSSLAKISSKPPLVDQNASEPEAKVHMPSAQSKTRPSRHATQQSGNAGIVGARTTHLDLSPTAANQQPGTIAMPSQKTSVPDANCNHSFNPKHLQEVVALLATARKGRGWPASIIQGQLKDQRNIVMDERTMLEYLGEGIRLGILKQKTNPPTGSRFFPLTFYAVKKWD